MGLLWHLCWSSFGADMHLERDICCEHQLSGEMWEKCWGDTSAHSYAELKQSCCTQEAKPPIVGASVLSEREQLERLRNALGFSAEELLLFIDGLPESPPLGKHLGRRGSWKRAPCAYPERCVRQGFSQLFHSMLQAGMIPIREHPSWNLREDDLLMPYHFLDYQDNIHERFRDIPPRHELSLDRIQLAKFVERVRPHLRGGRCLTWDAPESMGSLSQICSQVDIIVYNSTTSATRGSHGIRFDTNIEASNIPDAAMELILCPFVFEHVSRPWMAMSELFRVLAPGGQVIWAAPFIEEVHANPSDYFRFTPAGAEMLARSSGFTVLDISTPGGLKVVAGRFLGENVAYWTPEEMHSESDILPNIVLMLLQKPFAKSDQ
eukprot:TRINITY_DN57031_c0_g1_i1.p1 TRINITY_DN57031_c0_g1~~TRINITY_DN57031_c0_g1_i1.p1  ORF type:complete len:378 (-),score=34.96 TRINITY_DN57031_c0_g1_i1:527-1660(-)